jgi:hypothetical protein
MGKKTLDFKGTYKDFLLNKNIKISNIVFPKDKKVKGLRFKYPLNTMTFTIDSYDYEVINGFDMAIKTFLTYLGDKTIFRNGYGREYKINWR